MSPIGFLRWVYLARLTLAAGIFVAALRVWTQPEVAPEATLLATLMLVTALGFTVGSFWHTHLARAQPSRNFLYGQVVFDVVLVTAVVHLTGGGLSEFAPLYVLVIAEGALLLPIPGGFLTGALAVALYFADAVWGGEVAGMLGGVAGERELGPGVLTRMALFAVLALVTAWLGERVRRAGTQLGEVESELRQLRLETGDILSALDSGVVTLDEAGRLVYLNPAAEMLLGLRHDEWLGRPALEELDRAAPGTARVVKRTLSSRRAVPWYETHAAGASTLRVLGVRSTPLDRGDDGLVVTLVVQDITDGKRVEAANRRADRLGAVAELAASLAHEIKNPLASIRSAVEQLTRAGGQLRSGDRGVLGSLVLTESDRLSRLLSGFLEFSRVELHERTILDLAQVAGEAVEVVRQHPDAVGGAAVEIEYTGPVQVEGDPDLLHRVVFNLVLNAIQHSPEDASVRVRVADVDERRMPGNIRFSHGAMILVSDRGPGIDPDDVARIFDPFFTTRQGGSGLGLALVHRAVEAHEGVILVDPAEGGGTTFRVYLPARQKQVA
jgi:two-component system, NtrC family, sensor histidine kinase PilS